MDVEFGVVVPKAMSPPSSQRAQRAQGAHGGFKRMLKRVKSKIGSVSVQRSIRGLLASQKGRATLFKGIGRPGLVHLAEEMWLWSQSLAPMSMSNQFDMLYSEHEEARNQMAFEMLSTADQVRIHATGAPWIVWQARIHPDWHDFARLPYASFYGAQIEHWERQDSELMVELDGQFSDSVNKAMRRVAIFFQYPKARALWCGVPTEVPGVGVWSRDQENEKVFFKSWRPKGKSLGLEGLPRVKLSELSMVSEVDPAIRFCMGEGREVEIEISAKSVEVAWGEAEIQAVVERKALEKIVKVALVGRVGCSARESRGCDCRARL